MKKFLIVSITLFFTLPIFAGTKLISGDLGVLYGSKEIPVVLNWDNAVYGKNGNLNDFLNKAYRDSKWESKSLDYFLNEANKKIGEYGSRLVEMGDASNYEYFIVINVNSISKGGDIKGTINLISVENHKIISCVEYSSDESDNDDEIAFRDQLGNIGENYGKILEKSLKKAYKESKRK